MIKCFVCISLEYMDNFCANNAVDMDEMADICANHLNLYKQRKEMFCGHEQILSKNHDSSQEGCNVCYLASS